MNFLARIFAGAKRSQKPDHTPCVVMGSSFRPALQPGVALGLAVFPQTDAIRAAAPAN